MRIHANDTNKMEKFFNKNFTIQEYHEGIKNGEFSVVQAVEAFFDFIKKQNSHINAFIDMHEVSALHRAQALDGQGFSQDAGLFGVPVAIKDNMLIKGTKTTSASRILEHYIASYDATVVRRLQDAGAIVLGKTNLDEFAMGSSTEYSMFGPTKNPYDHKRVAGGSSGGSAAAVASGMALGAFGSDTGGSIRQPAGFCGVVGLKPTYGAVSRYGLMALASSLDQIGPFAKTVRDAAKLFHAISGHDPLDSTSISHGWESGDDLVSHKDIKELTIGVPKEYFISGVAPEVEHKVHEAISAFERDGFKIKEVSLPHTTYALSCYYIILPAEASANLARYDGMRYSPIEGLHEKNLSLLERYLWERGEGIGQEPTRRILLGTFVLSSGYYDAYYTKAQKVRRLILNDFEEAFQEVDVLMTPVTPTTAFKIGEKTDDPLAMYLSDIFTIPANLAGLPALSLPTQSSWKEGELPVNFQIIGNHLRERDILSLGHYYETKLRS